jgi:hypothetical protein
MKPCLPVKLILLGMAACVIVSLGYPEGSRNRYYLACVLPGIGFIAIGLLTLRVSFFGDRVVKRGDLGLPETYSPSDED